ncbi:MAG: response regulator [Chloroflexi bacterium]|nr:response regulator [Chloroflexota bacterium]
MRASAYLFADESGGNEADPRISVGLIAGLMVAVGVVIFFISEGQAEPAIRLPLQTLVLALFGMSVAVWITHSLSPNLARWLAAVALIASVYVASRWLPVQGALALLIAPTVGATLIVGPTNAVILAIVGSAILMLATRTPAVRIDLGAAIVTLIGTWSSLITIYVSRHPVAQLAEWAWGYYDRAQRLLEEARNHQMELEQALRDLMSANHQLALSNERIATLRLIAEEAQKAKASFVARVSHEFRTPLNMIIGLVDLLTETPKVYGQELPAPLFEDLEIVQRNCRHLSSMINDVLDLSQAEAGRLVLHRELVDLPRIVEDAVMVVRPLIDKKRLTLEQDIQPGLPQVYCDKTRIRQVVLNLISNAARFTERGGIVVRMAGDGRHVTVAVADTGPGIATQDLESIFEPFSHASNRIWPDKGGSGIGLSVSKQFINLHGGRIWVNSIPGAGSEFVFDLPVSPPPAHPSRPGHQISQEWMWIERESRSQPPQTAPEHRVVVCDETSGLHDMLSRVASDEIAITNVRGLSETVSEAAHVPAHVVIVNSPSQDRLHDLLEQARTQLRHTPIVGCTVAAPVTSAQSAGARDHLTKPVTRARLQSAIESVGPHVRRILLADDDPDVLQLITRMIAACDPEIEVATASSGPATLAQLARVRPDLVLLDIVMPDLDGWQVLRLKHEDETIRDIPVILLSAQDLASQPPTSDALTVTIDRGLSVSELLSCSLKLSELLLHPQQALDPVPR